MASGSYEVLKVDVLEHVPAMVDQGKRASHPMKMPAGMKKMMNELGAQRKRLGADTESESRTRLSKTPPPKKADDGSLAVMLCCRSESMAWLHNLMEPNGCDCNSMVVVRRIAMQLSCD